MAASRGGTNTQNHPEGPVASAAAVTVLYTGAEYPAQYVVTRVSSIVERATAQTMGL